MKWILPLYLVLTFGSCQSTSKESQVWAVDAVGFQKQMEQHPEAILVDIRTSGEIAQGKIARAIEIDYYQSDFVEKINQLDHTKPVFVYCAVGGRSQSAIPLLQKAGFKEIYHLSSGVQGWTQAGYPLQK